MLLGRWSVVSDVRDWVVTYKSSSRAPVEVWATITGVPASLELEDVSTALELWERWPAWQARTRPGSVVNVRRRTRRDDEHAAAASVLPWAMLAPSSRRVQVALPGSAYAACRRAARAEGVSLAAWVTRTLAAAAGAELALDMEAPPAFVDVPLPGFPGGGE